MDEIPFGSRYRLRIPVQSCGLEYVKIEVYIPVLSPFIVEFMCCGCLLYNSFNPESHSEMLRPS